MTTRYMYAKASTDGTEEDVAIILRIDEKMANSVINAAREAHSASTARIQLPVVNTCYFFVSKLAIVRASVQHVFTNDEGTIFVFGDDCVSIVKTIKVINAPMIAIRIDRENYRNSICRVFSYMRNTEDDDNLYISGEQFTVEELAIWTDQ